jgi:FMN phosphatase YigB (HAD superfamily)
MEKLIFPKIPFNEFKGVLLDIDNTIYHYESCHKLALNSLLKELSKLINLPLEPIKHEFLKARKKVNKALYGTASSHSRFLYIQLTLEKILGFSDFYNTIKLEKLYWEIFLKKMELNVDAKKFILKCNEKNIPICCLTDLTAEIQFKKLLKLNLENRIKYIVTSEEVGIEKPNKKMFEKALEKLNIKANQVIMIGDSTPKDIFGGEALGIKSFLVKSI